MGRAARVFLEGGIFHVYNRIARGVRVFGDDDEASRFVDGMRNVKNRDGLTIFAWVVMHNHFHVALRQGPVPLARSIKTVQHGFSRNYNARKKEFGPLWQGRYKAKLVEDPRYFHQLLVYIHLNPVTAGIVKDPGQYRWSGHRELVGSGEHPLIDVDQVLMLFGKNKNAATGAYVRNLKGARTAEWIGEDPGRLPWWRLGRPKKKDDAKLEPAGVAAYVDELGRSTGISRPRFLAGEFLEEGYPFRSSWYKMLWWKLREEVALSVAWTTHARCRSSTSGSSLSMHVGSTSSVFAGRKGFSVLHARAPRHG